MFVRTARHLSCIRRGRSGPSTPAGVSARTCASLAAFFAHCAFLSEISLKSNGGQQAEAQEDWSGVTETSCAIDGVPVPGLENPQYTPYLTQSLPFSYTTARSNSVLGPVYGESCIPGGTTIGPAVTEGVYLMVPPMTAGHHTISFTGVVGPASAPYLAVDLTYNVTSQPPALSIATQGSAIELSWPQSQSSYIVETAMNLISPAWSPVGVPLLATNGTMQATVPIGSGSQYFRLHGQ